MKEFFKKLAKAIWSFVQYDGLLHFFVCAVIVLLFMCKNLTWVGVVLAIVLAISKEVIDVINLERQVPLVTKRDIIVYTLHDLLFDVLGICLPLLLLI